MTVPTAYTEASLAEFMIAALGDLGADLGLTGPGADFDEAINDVLIAYGADDIADIAGASNIAKLRALARVQAWRLAVVQAAARYDMSDGTQSLKRSQLMGAAEKALAIAEADAAVYGTSDDGSGYSVAVDAIVYSSDPYAYLPDSARVLP